MDVRKDYLGKFTSSPDFEERLKVLLLEVGNACIEGSKKHGDAWAFSGLPMLVSDCYRKAGRAYRYVIRDQKGKGDLEDELWDLVIYSVYTLLYYRMLKGEDTGGK